MPSKWLKGWRERGTEGCRIRPTVKPRFSRVRFGFWGPPLGAPHRERAAQGAGLAAAACCASVPPGLCRREGLRFRV